MRNPVVRLKTILGEILLNGRIAMQQGAEAAQRLEGMSRRLERLDEIERNLRIVAEAAPWAGASAEGGAVSSRPAVLNERLSSYEVRERILAIAALLRPCRAQGHGKRRIGGAHDGGYVMLDDWTDVVGAISIGIGTDDAWDRAVLGRGVPVAQFDHTISAPPGTAEGLAWLPLGIAAQDINNLRSLRSMLALSALPATGDLLLKLDAEADEWPSLAPGDTAAPLGRFRQMVMELHWFERVGDPAWFETALQALRHIHRTHAVVHVHANNGGGMALLGGICFPRVLEVTFARRDAYAFEVEDGPFPTPLDTACNPVQPDLYLGSFRFPAPEQAA